MVLKLVVELVVLKLVAELVVLRLVVELVVLKSELIVAVTVMLMVIVVVSVEFIPEGDDTAVVGRCGSHLYGIIAKIVTIHTYTNNMITPIVFDFIFVLNNTMPQIILPKRYY